MAFLPPQRRVARIAHRDGDVATGVRAVPEETPVAMSFNGASYAVMMATPADLEDFAIGFALTEGVVASASEIRGLEIVDVERGVDLQIELGDAATDALKTRRRRIAGPVGCGLCGIESIDEAVRAVPATSATGTGYSAGEIAQAARLLSAAQPLHQETHAVHAAGLYIRGSGIVAAREDVGRHNALDKLAGALARSGTDGSKGAVVITSRVSVEMVQKTAVIGSSVLIAVSAPTALAIRTAEDAGITLVALVRGDDFEIFTHADRISGGARADVA